LLGAPATAAEEPQIEARLEPARVGLDEIATLSIELVSGGLMGGLSAETDFDLDNLEVVDGPHRSDSFNWLNGRASRRLSLVWRLRPLRTGPARVTGLRLVVRGQTIALPDREIEVQQEPTGAAIGAPGGPAAPGDPFADPFGPLFERRRLRGPLHRPKLFLEAVAEPSRPYVGQQVLYTIHLYTQADIVSVQPRELPSFRGFWAREVPPPQHQRAEMVEREGERYGRVVLLRRALFPLAPGRREIEPVQVDFALRVAEPGLFGSLLSSVQEARRRTEALTVEVQELPAAPPGFGGAVGRMELEAGLEPRELQAGEAATLTVTLSGEGHLQSLADPVVAAPEGLRLFPPQEEASDEVAGTTVRGRRSWSYVVVPERPGRYTLPELALPYFDPASAEYRVASAPALELAAVEAPAPPGSSPEPAAAATAAPAAPAWLRHRAALGLAGGAAGLGLATLAWWSLRRGRRLGSPGPTGQAGRRAPRSERRRLAERLREAGRESRPRQAAAAIEDAWREFLHGRWQIPPGAPSPQWPDLLAERGANPQAARDLARLADDLHYLRYAPQLSSADALRADLIERSRRLLRPLA
jgi:hypothetical protein